MANSQVHPYEKIPAEVIKLPAPDVSVPKIWASRLLFWRLENPADFAKCYENLKEGLSRLLSDIPTLVGHLERGPSGDFRDLNIAISENASVEFTFEDVTENTALPSYPDLERTGFPTTGLRDALFPKMLIAPVTEGAAMFCAKLNLLRGGVVLAYGSNHVATDGWAVSEMEKLWALHTVDVSQGVSFRKHKIATPDTEIRQRFSEMERTRSNEPLNPALQIIPSEEAFMRLHKDAAAAAAAGKKAIWKIMGMLADAGERPEPRASTIFKFSPAKLAELKKAASSANPEEWISTMDALVALYWSRIARIQKQSRKGHERSTCFFYINARARLEPPIPMAYIGNVVIPSSAVCSLGDLESDSDGLKAAAQGLRKANSTWAPSQVVAMCNKIATLPIEEAVDVNRELILGKHNLSYNDLSKFSSNCTNWGAPLGKVGRVRLPRPALPGGCHGVVVYPKLPDGSLEVMIGCTERTRQALLKDPIFKQYAEFVSVSLPPGQSLLASALMQTVFTLHSTGRRLWRAFTGHRTALGGTLLAFAIYSAFTRRNGKTGATGSK